MKLCKTPNCRSLAIGGDIFCEPCLCKVDDEQPMKLILCHNCHDVVKLDMQLRMCKCGRCGGQYLDKLQAEYWGDDAFPLGFNNYSLMNAWLDQPEEGQGQRFEAFVIPKKCPTMVKVDIPAFAKLSYPLDKVYP